MERLPRFGSELTTDRSISESEAEPSDVVLPGKHTLAERLEHSPQFRRVIQRRATGGAVSASARTELDRAAGGAGRSLPAELRRDLEHALGVDLSAVRIHTDGAAASAAAAIGAHAFTQGQDIFFAAGSYDPDGDAGRRLLAHEVVHTVQQARGQAASAGGELELSTPGDALETEADRAADRIVAGQAAEVTAAGGPSIARDGPPRTGLTADMLQLDGPDLQMTGPVTAVPASGDSGPAMSINAPDIWLRAGVHLKPEVTLGPGQSIEVGPVQTLLGSERVAVYRTSTGNITEHRMVAGTLRDAMWNPRTHQASYPEPWYGEPRTVSDDHRDERVAFHDQPGFEAPMRLGNGTLAETRGAERFSTSISAKRSGALVPLHVMQWQVPWNLTIDASRGGTGGQVTGSNGGPAPSVTTGPIAHEASDEYTRFQTVDDARSVGWRRLLDMLPAARSRDAAAASLISQAIAAENPTFTLRFKCTNSYAWVGTDAVTARATAHRGVSRQFAMDTNNEVTMTFHLNEVADATRIDGSTSLHIAVVVDGHTGTMDWEHPWQGADDGWHDLRGLDHRYQVRGNLA